MGLEEVGDNPGTGTSASGTAPDLSREMTTPRASDDAGSTVAPASARSDGDDSGDSGGKSTGEAASSVVGRGLSGASRVGYGILAAGVNGSRAAMAAFNTGLRAIASAMSAGGAHLASAAGGIFSPAVGTGIVAGGGIFATGMTMVIVANTFFAVPDAVKNGASELECTVSAPDMSVVAAEGGDMEENAKKVYSILSGLGMPDENIAGILGNFQTESGIDPASVETVATNEERNKPGPKKLKIEKANFAGSAGLEPKPVAHLGIGLGQWTNERGVNLRKYAEEKNGEWYDMNVQMAYAISADSGAKIYKDMIAGINPGANNPEDAASFYLKQWERPADIPGNDPIRRKQASSWFAKMGGWSADTSAANSVLAMAETEVKAANNKSTQQQMLECSDPNGSNNGGNADAAKALATYAWPIGGSGPKSMSAGNDGTYMYIWLHDEILKGDPYYASCDRSVATAVRWSGTDDSFEFGGTSAQYQYLSTQPDKWEKIEGWDKSKGTDMLKPGDILITSSSGHILMYLGEDVIKEVWGGTEYEDDVQGFDVGQGSLNDQSPGLMNYYLDTGDNRHYVAFRNRQKEDSSKFKELSPPRDLKPATGPQRHTTPGG